LQKCCRPESNLVQHSQPPHLTPLSDSGLAPRDPPGALDGFLAVARLISCVTEQCKIIGGELRFADFGRSPERGTRGEGSARALHSAREISTRRSEIR